MTLNGLKHIWVFFFFLCAELQILTIPPIECDICHIFFKTSLLEGFKVFQRDQEDPKEMLCGGVGGGLGGFLRGRAVGANFNRSVLRSETAIFLKASLSKEY